MKKNGQFHQNFDNEISTLSKEGFSGSAWIIETNVGNLDILAGEVVKVLARS